MKITIHPMFAAAGIFSAIFGGLPIFLIYTLTALMHECGHIFYAKRLGFVCDKVKLMPYGAAAVCNLEGISLSDEIRLSLAGPAVNFVVCIFITAIWWFFPLTYAYTDTIMQANVVMLAINLLPCYPLDGGRAAKCLLLKVFSQKITVVILYITTILVSVALIVITVITTINLSVLSFALFLILSLFERPVNASKINFATADKLKRGLEVKYVLVSGELTYRKAISLLDDKKYLILRLESGEEMTQDELYEGFASCGLYDKVFV
ncbi:MAG: hypothetical protein LUD27_02185 [Clostridia bacterium]|nr:hypothetical protein [Clostridia bacterium]